MTVHDDGTTSNDDRLGAIGDLAFTIERAGLEGEDLLVVAGDNLVGYSLPEFVGFWRGKGGSAIAVHEVADRELLKRYGVVELDADDRVVGFEEKPARAAEQSRRDGRLSLPRAGSRAPSERTWTKATRRMRRGTSSPGCTPASPVYGYRFTGEWHDIGDLGQLLEADNRLREQPAAGACRDTAHEYSALAARFRSRERFAAHTLPKGRCSAVAVWCCSTSSVPASAGSSAAAALLD